VSDTIGILDSGVGGLSVLQEIRALLPSHPLIYLGDSAWCPYGNKPFEQIRARVCQHTDFLMAQGASLIVIACNSATIAAVEHLRASYPIPFVGMEPAIKPASQITKTGVIGVLATEASLAGEKFHRLVDTHAEDLRVITTPCPKFVELVEAGILAGPEVEEAIREYTAPLLAEGVDVLVLGCTHYPFLRETIAKVAGPSVTLLDTGAAVAKRVASLVETDKTTDSPVTLYTTGSAIELPKLLKSLLPDLSCEVRQA
jgi:glutamate racemase